MLKTAGQVRLESAGQLRWESAEALVPLVLGQKLKACSMSALESSQRPSESQVVVLWEQLLPVQAGWVVCWVPVVWAEPVVMPLPAVAVPTIRRGAVPRDP
jgi:hypothetical protein